MRDALGCGLNGLEEAMHQGKAGDNAAEVCEERHVGDKLAQEQQHPGAGRAGGRGEIKM